MRAPVSVLTASVSLLISNSHAGVIYSTGFDDYANGTLSGQLAWIGTGGSWAVSASVNTGQVGFSVIASDGAIVPPSATGRMVRMTTSRFGADRTKAWLDLLNSNKWATASAGGNDVLETTLKLYIPSGVTVPCQFGVMVSKDAVTTSSGFVINGQTGAVSYLDGGYAAANRYSFGTSVSLAAWHSCTFRWNPTTGAASLAIDGVQVGSYTSTIKGGVYAVNMFSYTDFSGTSGSSAYAYADDYSVAAVPPVLPPCAGDFNGDRKRDGADLGFLLGSWGTAAGDLNADGTTDGADLGTLLGNWGNCP